MAIVTKVRKNGVPVYYAVVRQNGRQVWLNCGTSIKRAREAHATYVHRANQNMLPQMRDCRFSVLAEKFFTEGCHDRRPQTVSGYQGRTKNHLLPFFSDVRVRQGVTTEAVQRWIGWMKGRSASDATVRAALTTLSAMLSYAVDIGLIYDNPCRRVRPPKDSGGLGGVLYVLKPREVRRLVDHTPSKNGDKACLLFLATTGCRPQEAAEVRFRDISFAEGLVVLSRTATRHGVNPVKNGRSRTVPLTPEMLKVLGEEKRRLEAGGDDLCFPAVRGGRRDMGRFARDVLRPSLTRAGLVVPEGSASLYILRKSLASNLLSAGENVKVIGELLGQSEAVLLRYYAKTRQEDAAAAIGRLSNAMSGEERVAASGVA